MSFPDNEEEMPEWFEELPTWLQKALKIIGSIQEKR